jgi:hypothetical protein
MATLLWKFLRIRLVLYIQFISYVDNIHINAGGARWRSGVKALRYKSAGRGFDSRWCHWNFSVI